VPAAMHAGHDYDLIVNNSVEKAVRQTTQVYDVSDGKQQESVQGMSPVIQ
jgi:hypothetical protein